MSQATWTFAGVILGAIIAGGVSLWREQFITDRERRAQQAEREQRRKDVRDAFQRESMMALQEAIEEHRSATVLEFDPLLRRNRDSDSEQERVKVQRLSERWFEKDVSVKKLWARVFDAELRGLVKDFRGACFATVNSEEVAEIFKQMNHANELARQVHDRIAVLLPELY
jgi:hypothetical protein